jgi:hypothetical protein
MPEPRAPAGYRLCADRTAEDRFIKAKRSVDVGDSEKIRDREPVLRRHQLFCPICTLFIDDSLFRHSHELQKRLSCQGRRRRILGSHAHENAPASTGLAVKYTYSRRKGSR